MKSVQRIRSVVTLFALLTCLLILAWATDGAPQARGNQSPVLNAGPVSSQAAAQPATTEPAIATKFDGKALYRSAFIQIRDTHHALYKSTRAMWPEEDEGNAKYKTPFRDEWSREWEHKFDESNQLDTLEGTDEAVLQMLQSLKR